MLVNGYIKNQDAGICLSDFAHAGSTPQTPWVPLRGTGAVAGLVKVFPANRRDFTSGTLHAVFSSTPVLKARLQNTGTTDVLMELNELRNGIRTLAEEVEDDRTKAKLKSLLERANILEGGKGNQSALSDVGFDCQGELERLQEEFEKMKTTYYELKSEHQEQSEKLQKVESEHEEQSKKLQKVEGKLLKVESEHQELKSEHQELKSEHQELKSEHQELKHDAVLRQIAINIEMELKMENLRICSDEAVKHLKHSKGKRKGKFNFYSIAKLQVSEAQDLAQHSARQEDLDAINTNWFGKDEDAEDNFVAAMAMLKRFSHDGAHPTELDGIPVNAEKAKELVEGMQQKQANGKELQGVALSFVDKLKTIRKADKDGSPFLRNLQDFSEYYN
jgi:DNA repair exonuclease SbcCD ATPase subunit